MNKRGRVRAGVLTLGCALAIGAVVGVGIAVPGASAQETDPPGEAAEPSGAGSSGEMTAKETRQKAKQDRIDRYLQKKADKINRKAEEQATKEAEAAAAAALAATGPDPEQTRGWKRHFVERKGYQSGMVVAESEYMSRELREIQERLQTGALSREPEIMAYLEAVGRGDATPGQIGTLATMIAERGYTEDAVAYYLAALELDSTNQAILLNLGTTYLQMSKWNDAGGTFEEVLELDPNRALAHYNLGIVHQQLNHFDEAVEHFRIAFILEPDLGDPAVNPSVITNPIIVPVRILLFEQENVRLSSPRVEVPGGELDNR